MFNHTDVAVAANQLPADANNSRLYGYIPTLWICALFITLFALSTLIHVAQAIYYRTWWLFPTAILSGVAEVLGWSARLWSSKSPNVLDPYLIQTTSTIIAPTPLVGANFIILGKVIERLGSQYSRLTPMMYSVVFLSCDFVALIVQAVGGAEASRAVQTRHNPDNGGHIMLGGIVFQMAAITIYVACASEFLLRFLADKPIRQVVAPAASSYDSRASSPDREKANVARASAHAPLDWRMKYCLAGLTFSTTVIFIRSVYRTIELIDGWSGRIITTQVYFNVLDGAMIVIAMFTLNFVHPGFTLMKRD